MSRKPNDRSFISRVPGIRPETPGKLILRTQMALVKSMARRTIAYSNSARLDATLAESASINRPVLQPVCLWADVLAGVQRHLITAISSLLPKRGINVQERVLNFKRPSPHPSPPRGRGGIRSRFASNCRRAKIRCKSVRVTSRCHMAQCRGALISCISARFRLSVA